MSECVVFWLGKWWKRKKKLLYGAVIGRLPSPLEQLDTVVF